MWFVCLFVCGVAFCWLFVWLASLVVFVAGLVGWLFCLVGLVWLAGLVGWLVGLVWLVGWLVGWLVDRSVPSYVRFGVFAGC